MDQRTVNVRLLPTVIRSPGRLLTLLGLAFVFSCGSLVATSIGDIQAKPREFEGRIVTIRGTVTGSLNVLVFRGFTVRDGTGEIGVVTDRAVPKVGTLVRVTGRVQQEFAFGSQSLVVIVEERPDTR